MCIRDRDDFTAGQPECERDRTDGGLNGSFWQIGNHTEKPLFECKGCTGQTKRYTDRTEDQSEENHSDGSAPCGKGIADIHGSADPVSYTHLDVYKRQPL